MNVLILSCSTGEGHNSAAQALYNELISRNDKVYIKDALSFCNKKTEDIIKGFFNGVAIKTPYVFGAMYKAGSFVSNTVIKSPIYLANLLYSEKLYKFIINSKIDIIICTHLFPMEALTFLKQNKSLKAKCYAVLTDYTAIPFIEETSLDGYFIPSKDLEKNFTDKKIMKSKLHSFGIPVSAKFSTHNDKEAARNKLNLPINKKIILIMGGGIGCGNIQPIVNELVCKTDSNTLIIVITGKNKILEDKLKKYFNKDKVKVVGFTKQVDIYMDASDIFLSKPGGLSSTEAAVKTIPLIHTSPIPGCETENAKFFGKKGMSIICNNSSDIVNNAVKLLERENLQNKMKKNQSKYINKNATKDIINYIKSINM